MEHPLSWKEVIQYNKNPPRVALARKPEIDEKYETHKAHISKNNIKIDEYINSKYFSGDNENKICYFVENSFPYNCDTNIQHYLIWFNPKFNNMLPETLNSSKFDNLVKKEVNKNIGFENQYIYFENINELKSVRSIRHIHIFIKSI